MPTTKTRQPHRRYYWKTRGGTHTGHRGVGMWHNYLFMETHDDYLVSLDARTGKERWHVEIADFSQQYFSSMAPVIIGNHVPENNTLAIVYLIDPDPRGSMGLGGREASRSASPGHRDMARSSRETLRASTSRYSA